MSGATPSRPTVGFLGLGGMGSAMAGRLVETGHDVVVWNRSPAAVEALVALGARAAADRFEALRAPVSFSMLADDAAAEAVLDDAGAAAAAGQIHASSATISPRLADRLAARFLAAGSTYVSTPVVGRSNLAAAGQINILAAGPAAALDRVQPYLDALGRRTWRLGETPSQANAVKVAVNYNIIHVMQALGETIAMVERLGVDPGMFVELLTNSLFGGVAYTVYGTEIVDRTYKPAGFAMALGRKDLGLAEEVATDGGVTPPTMQVLKDVFDRALRDPELRDADWGGIAEVTRRDLLP